MTPLEKRMTDLEVKANRTQVDLQESKRTIAGLLDIIGDLKDEIAALKDARTVNTLVAANQVWTPCSDEEVPFYAAAES